MCVFSHVYFAHILLVKLISPKETGNFSLSLSLSPLVRIQGGIAISQTIFFWLSIYGGAFENGANMLSGSL